MDLFETLETLCSAPGPSGFEWPAVEAAAGLLAPLADEVWTDRQGNVLALRRCGRPGAKKVLLDAHLDEVGMIVTGWEDGFLRFDTLGGIDPRVLPDREVTVLTEPPCFGVVAVKPPHIMQPGEADKSVPTRELRIDIGISQEEAERAVPIGTPVVYRQELLRLANGQIAGKSLDDRACFAVLLRTLELLREETLDVDLYVLGSCLEETSGAGALTATFAIAPDCAVAVDVTFARTHDGPKETGYELGKGPATGIGPNCAHWMVRRLRRVSEAEGIAWNPEVMAGETGTNGWGMQAAREGVPVALVSLPLKYMHTPLEVISAEDAEQTARLLAAFLRGIGEEDALCCSTT